MISLPRIYSHATSATSWLDYWKKHWKGKSVPFLAKLFDEYQYQELLEMEPRSAKDEKKLHDFEAGKAKQEAILDALRGGNHGWQLS